jgi:uridine kinase
VVAVRVSRTDAAAWIRDRLAGLAGTRWIGIDGFGAAGKTELAAEIATMLPGSSVVHVDDFSRPGLPGWDRERFGSQLLEPLLAGGTARYQRWDYLADRGLDWVEVASGSPVIVEGVSATDARLPVPWDLTVWLDVAAAERRRRILERDGDAMLQHWRTDWWPSEEAYAAEQEPQHRATVVVANSEDGVE